jgi:hypothetical protein
LAFFARLVITDPVAMSSQASSNLSTEAPVKRHMSVDTALQVAWGTWFALLAIPFVMFIAVLWHFMLSEGGQANQDLGEKWFIGVMIYMAFGVPASFFTRSRMFKGYWAGKHVPPRDYLIGMVAIWVALEIGGLAALLGCLISNTALPNLLPALLAFMLFTPLWPSGHSMVRPLKNERDPAHYQEPR